MMKTMMNKIKNFIFHRETQMFDIEEYTLTVFYEEQTLGVYRYSNEVFVGSVFVGSMDDKLFIRGDPRSKTISKINQYIQSVPFSFLDRYRLNDVSIVEDYKKLRFFVETKTHTEIWWRPVYFGLTSFSVWQAL